MKRDLAVILAAFSLLTGCGANATAEKGYSGSLKQAGAAPAESEAVPAETSVSFARTENSMQEKTVTKQTASKANTGDALSKLPVSADVGDTAPESSAAPAETHITDTTPLPRSEPVQQTSLPAVTAPQATEPPVTASSAYEAPPVTDPPAYEPTEPGHSDQRSHFISVPCILQYPELPTGCEITSLTMLLNYYGYGADKLTMAREYLPKMDFFVQNGVVYGADFNYTFAGDPENGNSYGCYAPCIVTAANAYLSGGHTASSLSGAELDTLFTDLIDRDIPALIWITSDGLLPSYLSESWYTPDGGYVTWRKNEHCVVLTGYDYGSGLVYVADPLAGNVAYDMNTLRARYDEMYRQCVYLS